MNLTSLQSATLSKRDLKCSGVGASIPSITQILETARLNAAAAFLTPTCVSLEGYKYASMSNNCTDIVFKIVVLLVGATDPDGNASQLGHGQWR